MDLDLPISPHPQLPVEIWSKVLSYTISLKDFHSLCSSHRQVYYAFHSLCEVMPLILRIARFGRPARSIFSPDSSNMDVSTAAADTISLSSFRSASTLPDEVVDAQTAMAIVCLKHPWPQGPDFEKAMADYFLNQLDQHNIPAKRALALAAVRCHLPILSLFATRTAFRQPLRVILHQASMQGELDTVSAVLNVWGNLEEVSAVVYSISQFGNYNTLRHMLEFGAWSIDALGLACVEQYDDITSLFLYYLPASAPAYQLNFAFLIACQMGDSEACGRLVQMGADMRCENDLAVVLASRSGHVELLRQMIDHYSPDPDVAVLACSLAAREEKFEVVELFASRGVFPSDEASRIHQVSSDYTDEESVLPLTLAARNLSAAAVEALLSQGANPHAKDGEALVQASKMGSVESVRILLMAGVDPASRDHEALISACHRITKSSHTSSPTTPSSPTLMALEAYNGVQIVRLLLKYGSSPSARDGLPLKMARQSSVGVSQAALVHALDNALRMEVGMEDMEASAQYEDELLEYQMEQYGGK